MNKLSYLKDKKIPIYVSLGIIIAFFLLNSSFIPFIDEISPFTSESRRLYVLAREYQRQDNYREAIIDYVKIPSVYRAYDAVLFQMAKCATAIGDEKITIQSLKKLTSKFSSSPIAPIGLYNLGQAYVRTNQSIAAEETFNKVINRYPDSNYAKGSLYYLGLISSAKNPKETLNFWLDYLEKTPDGRFSSEILNKIEHLNFKMDVDQNLILGRALLANARYNEALSFLNNVPASKSWYYLAKTNYRLGKNSTALAFLKEGLLKYTTSQDEENIKKAMDIYVEISPLSAIEDWSFLASKVAESRDYALYNKTPLVSTDNALQIYKQIAERYSKGKDASEALWMVFWDKFKNGRYEEAIALGQKHYRFFQNMPASPQILFWTSKAYERIGDSGKAKYYYKKVIELYPDSYYSFRASERINFIDTGIDNGWDMQISNLPTNYKNTYPYSIEQLKKKFGVTLAELVLAEDVETIEMISDDKFLLSWAKQKRGMTSKSIIDARDEMNSLMPKPAFDDERWKLIYPLKFIKPINQYSQANNIDPLIALSLLREESYFNSLAVSGSNARGLMQILPGTANDVARWNNFSSVSDFQLFDPETNIRIGTAYIKYTKETLWDHNMFAVAAYNCGPNAIKRWVSRKPVRDYDEFVESIPYDESRFYVKKVFRSYWNYKRVYNL